MGGCVCIHCKYFKYWRIRKPCRHCSANVHLTMEIRDYFEGKLDEAK